MENGYPQPIIESYKLIYIYMRTIKFRGLQKGKNADGSPKKWVFGYLTRDKKRDWTEVGEDDGYLYFIQHTDILSTQVERESVGQFTGLIDKNGKEIYEGDIVECVDETKHKIIWSDYYACFCLSDRPYIGLNEQDMENYEVISNIYENPELLEVK